MYDELIEDLGRFSGDPLGFVYWAFPWGEPEYELRDRSGPEDWQVRILSDLRDGLISVEDAIRIAVASGHGIGKSALVAWIILWAISTCTDTKGVVTANTETQLKTKTWVELAKWYRLFIARDLFKMTATALFSADPEHERTWRVDMVPWSERNTEAFAGLHNQGKRILVVFDEASAIPDVIWEVTEGALTDQNTEIIFCAFGNPTRNKGRFRACFEGGLFAHRWKVLHVDSRRVSFTNKKQIEEWIEDYGEDSDFVRIRIKGSFPRVDAESFIPLQLAMEAVNRVIEPQNDHPLILGVDVGRFGDDPTVIYPRRGRDGHSLPVTVLLGLDLMTQATRVSEQFNALGAQVVMVDGVGVGGGLIDRLRQLGIPVLDVQFGGKPSGTNEIERGVKYANKRAEIWGGLRDWLATGAIQNVPSTVDGDSRIFLVDELSGPQYGHNDREEIILEKKKDMRRRGVPSPNIADALACTFAYPVAKQNMLPKKPYVAPEYDPFDPERIYAGVH